MNIYFICWIITQYYFIDFIAQIVWALANVSSFSCLLCSFDITPLIHIDFCCFWFLSTLLFLSLQAAPSSSCILLPHPTTVHSCCCCCCVASVVSNSVRPHWQQPARLPRPWDSPGKNNGVGCHFLLQYMKVKSESEVAQSCPDSLRPHGLQPTRLLHPWDFPGKSTGVGCHRISYFSSEPQVCSLEKWY